MNMEKKIKYKVTTAFSNLHGRETLYKGCFRKPLPLWEGMNETLNQPKADEISQVL